MPALCEASERAAHCWDFSGGWHPECWPVYAALFDVPDWHEIVELMREIRRHV